MTINNTELFVPCEVFTRVCGFYRPVNQFNPGKKEEYDNRKIFYLQKTKVINNSLYHNS